MEILSKKLMHLNSVKDAVVSRQTMYNSSEALRVTDGAVYYNDTFFMSNCAKKGIYLMIQDIDDFNIFSASDVKVFLSLFGLKVTDNNNINGFVWDGNSANINIFK